MRRSIFNNQAIIFLTSILVIFVNILGSVHFVAITFAGVMFYFSQICYKHKMYYTLFFVLIAFLAIEITQGLAPFSLFLISFVLYTIVLPIIDRMFSIEKLKIIVDVVLFYLSVILVNYMATDELLFSFFYIVINITLDIIIIGLFL
ncbi:MAG: hypothetical protein WHU93_00265 [Arcobacteraceae bacterium]